MNDTKRNATISATINGNTLALTFANGETLTMRGDALNSDVQQYAMMHGLKQKLVDAAAISRNPETGRAATVGARRALTTMTKTLKAARPLSASR